MICADGTLGCSNESPFDAIVVAAGGPAIPQVLLKQLRVGGRLVIPIGPDLESQRLVRAVQRSEDDFEYEELDEV